MNAGMKDTAAWKVTREILDHEWGMDEDLDDQEFLTVCKMFKSGGGLWKEVMAGDMSHVSKLQDCIQNILTLRKLSKIAANMVKVSF